MEYSTSDKAIETPGKVAQGFTDVYASVLFPSHKAS